MPNKAKPHTAGIYVETNTELTSTADFQLHAKGVSDQYVVYDVLSELESHARALLVNFGCVFGTPVNWKFGTIPDSHTPIFKDSEINRTALDRAIDALDEIDDVRSAILNGTAADAALAGIRLGRIFERLLIKPHEANTVFGRLSRKARRSGALIGNNVKKAKAINLHAKIIAAFRRKIRLGWGRKKGIYANISIECTCSESTVRQVVQKYLRNQSETKR